MSNVQTAVADHLVTNSLGTINTDLFIGLERPKTDFVPSKAVFLFTSGGEIPNNFMGCPGTYREVFLEIWIRDEDNKQTQCQATAQAIFDELSRAELITGLSGFVKIDALESSPNYVGRNKANLHIYHVRMKVGYVHQKV